MSTRNAGSPVTWLRHFKRDLTSPNQNHSVPCGICTACCRSGMLPRVLPHELESLRDVATPDGEHIPLAADGRTCSQLKDGKCAIYKRRPLTCRIYDCRILLFSGIRIANQPELNEALEDWRSELKTPEDRALAKALAIARKQYVEMPDPDPDISAWERAWAIFDRAYALLAEKIKRT